MTKCPTCGGPCTKIVASTVFYGKAKEPIDRYKYDSLVKGEMVAEGVIGKNHLKRWAEDPDFEVLPVWRSAGMENEMPVLVIKKEDSVNQNIGGGR